MNLLMSAIAAASIALSAQPTPPVSPIDVLNEAPATEWIDISPEDVLVMELPSGTIYIQLQPDLAPGHVTRMRELTRAGFFNGLIYHRVIDGFMAQGGDPTGTGRGGSELPDLAPEFAREIDTIEAHIIGRDDRAAQVGFVGTVPVGTQAPTISGFLTGQKAALWGLHCQGVMSMARANQPNSANSQFFLMFGDARDNLDQGYTVWGKIVSGYRHARRINRGEPPVRPTPIVRMRVMADIPAEEQVDIQHLNPNTETFATYLKTTRQVSEDGYVRDMCNVNVPIRVDGEYSQ